MRFADLDGIIRALLVALGLTAAALALGGCSAIRVGYNNAPSLAYWWLDGYIDFDTRQTPQVRDALASLMAWHRKTELPQIAGLLRQAEAMAPADVTAEQVCTMADAARTRTMAFADRAEAPTAALLVQLKPVQLDHIARKFDERNAEFRGDWLDLPLAEQADKRYDKYVERGEDFYGPLSDIQRELLHAQARSSVFSASIMDTERRRRQQEGLTLLRELQARGGGQAQAKAAFHEWIAQWFDPPAGPYRLHREALLQEGCRNVAALHNSTTPTQRARAVERLRGYENDVKALMANPG